MSIHPEGKTCSDIGPVLILNDPPVRKLNFDWPISITIMFQDLSLLNLNFFTISPPEAGRSRLTPG